MLLKIHISRNWSLYAKFKSHADREEKMGTLFSNSNKTACNYGGKEKLSQRKIKALLVKMGKFLHMQDKTMDLYIRIKKIRIHSNTSMTASDTSESCL